MVRLPRESLLFSSPNHLCLVDVAHPKPSAPVVSLKPSSSTPPPAQCLSVVPPDPSSGSQGLAAWVDGPKRNVIYVSPLSTPTSSSSSSKQASPTATRWHPPQPVSSLLLSPDGRLLLAGCDDGRAYLWEVSSGLLRATWEPHFRAVSAIAWSADGGMVATGSEDGRVCVWSIVGLYHPSGPHPQPYATLSSHLLPITALSFSPATCNSTPSRAQLWSASKDGTVKLWDMRSRSLLADVVDPAGIAAGSAKNGASPAVDALAVDQTGRFAFVAAGGQVSRIDVYKKISEPSSAAAATAAYETFDPSSSSSATASSSRSISLPTSSGRPTSLCVLPSSCTLAVGTAQPSALLFVDIASRQVLRSVSLAGEGATATSAAATGAVGVTNVAGMYRPNEDERGEGFVANKAAAAPRIIAAKLDRVIRSAGGVGAHGVEEGEEEDDEEYWAILPDRWDAHMAEVAPSAYPATAGAAAAASSVPQTNGAAASTSDTELQSRLKASEARTAQLEAQVRRAAKLNDDLWGMLVKGGHVKEGEQASAAAVAGTEKGKGDEDDEGSEVEEEEEKGKTTRASRSKATAGKGKQKRKRH